MPKVNFSPARDGFQFGNYFVNQIANVPGIGKLQTAGRCGGMSYCVLDHYVAGRPVPGFKASDFGDKGVPPDGHPLADYIYQRQLDSFFTLSAVKFVTWSLAPDSGNFLVHGVRERTRKEEFKKLREAIDRGMPVPLGLIVARNLNDLGRNHQVVAYGYDYDAETQHMTVYIYDVNWPGQEITLTSGKDDAVWFESSPGKEQWRGWFVQDYAPRHLPPDLARPLAEAAEQQHRKAGCERGGHAEHPEHDEAGNQDLPATEPVGEHADHRRHDDAGKGGRRRHPPGEGVGLIQGVEDVGQGRGHQRVGQDAGDGDGEDEQQRRARHHQRR